MKNRRTILFISLFCIVAFMVFYIEVLNTNHGEFNVFSYYQNQKNRSIIKINKEFRQNLFNITISDEKDMAEIKAEIYPKNVYLGDFIYVSISLENKTHSNIVCPDNDYTPYLYVVRHSGKDWEDNIILNYKNEEHFLDELLDNEHVKITATERSVSENPPGHLPPGNRFLIDCCDFQLPPPKDFHNEFWEKIRFESTHKPVPLNIVFVFDNIYIISAVNVISRGEKEYKTLLQYSESFNTLSDKQLLKLEKELKPSTFRDFIHSHRLNRLYRQSKIEPDSIRNEILKWNNSLPEVQMIQSDCIILKKYNRRRYEPIPIENYDGYYEKSILPINLIEHAQ